jgi:hypothetical protein
MSDSGNNKVCTLPRFDLAKLRDRVRAAADIAEVAREAGFRRRGRAWHCGFHRDRTPSASVHGDRIRCFACNESWDAIGLVMRSEGLNFVEAVERLACRYGIPVGRRTRTDPRRQAETLRQARELAEVKRQLIEDYANRLEVLETLRRMLRAHLAALPNGVAGMPDDWLDTWIEIDREIERIGGGFEELRDGHQVPREGVLRRLRNLEYKELLGIIGRREAA